MRERRVNALIDWVDGNSRCIGREGRKRTNFCWVSIWNSSAMQTKAGLKHVTPVHLEGLVKLAI